MGKGGRIYQCAMTAPAPNVAPRHRRVRLQKRQTVVGLFLGVQEPDRNGSHDNTRTAVVPVPSVLHYHTSAVEITERAVFARHEAISAKDT